MPCKACFFFSILANLTSGNLYRTHRTSRIPVLLPLCLPKRFQVLQNSFSLSFPWAKRKRLQSWSEIIHIKQPRLLPSKAPSDLHKYLSWLPQPAKIKPVFSPMSIFRINNVPIRFLLLCPIGYITIVLNSITSTGLQLNTETFRHTTNQMDLWDTLGTFLLISICFWGKLCSKLQTTGLQTLFQNATCF